MKQILLSGANGRMGKVLQSLIAKHPQLEVAAGLDRTEQLDGPFPIYDRPEKITQPIDLVIDFSHYSNVPALLNYCVEQQLAYRGCYNWFDGRHADDAAVGC